MLRNLTGWHALIILATVLLIFGSTRLPALARSVGESVRILKKEANDDDAPRGGGEPRAPRLTVVAPDAGPAAGADVDANAGADAPDAPLPASTPAPAATTAPAVGLPAPQAVVAVGTERPAT